MSNGKSEINKRGEQNLEVEVAADNLAYVIYTSGKLYR